MLNLLSRIFGFRFIEKEIFLRHILIRTVISTNVFFLHLPNKNLSTKLKAQDDVEINIDLDEGDILTIPAYLKHESPLISQDNEKYILSFNSSITT